ncbi:MAG: GNAT family N-acetyltransferase [Gemmatimonadaceae bacterium]|nr:GNAT family N-acetyltransferase [Gemmatimonadaceae bacterium]
MHNLASRRRPAHPRTPTRAHLSATHAARAARPGDAADIHALIATFVDDGRLLPRALHEVESALDDFVVIVDRHDRVQACAALAEYSPSLAEVSSVAVAPQAQGMGLGSLAVRSVEAVARRRGVVELFALSLAEPFFVSLGYARTHLAAFPEKVARYEALVDRGVSVTPKACFHKTIA